MGSVIRVICVTHGRDSYSRDYINKKNKNMHLDLLIFFFVSIECFEIKFEIWKLIVEICSFLSVLITYPNYKFWIYNIKLLH